MINLFDIPNVSKIYFDESNFITFVHIDGMYSYCIDENNEPLHLSASTPLEEYLDGYKIIIPHDTERSSVV